MADDVYNKLEKLTPPPFVTTVVKGQQVQQNIFKMWDNLRENTHVLCRTKLLEDEGKLLSCYIERKGTQLRLEKALMLSQRIHKLEKRWRANGFVHEFSAFDDGVQLSLKTGGWGKGKQQQRRRKQGKLRATAAKTEKDIRLPSRQWANWIIYLALRDCLILAKIKTECERTTRYWLGLIGSSHHATDSLVAVGILSRMWYLTSTMVETLITVMYPTVCKLSIHLEPTKAENWLEDLKMPAPENLTGWLSEILGSPFIPARLSQALVSTTKCKSRVESFPGPVSLTASITINPTDSSAIKTVSQETVLHQSESDEDLGVPVEIPSTSTSCSHGARNPAKKPKKSIRLSDKWRKFFQRHKSKLKTSKGKKQFLVRIRKYLANENDEDTIKKLKRFRLCIKNKSYDEILLMANKFQKFLAKRLPE